MKKIKYFLLILVCAVSFLTCMEDDPFGGGGLKLLPDSVLFASAFSQYDEFLDESAVVDDTFNVQNLTSKRNRINNMTVPDDQQKQKDAILKNLDKAISIASDSTQRAKVFEQAEMVKRLGVNIKNAAEKWCANAGKSNYLKDYRWEYNLVVDDQINAWCMPGGKIVVYTGILDPKIIGNDTEKEHALATVMGHEVAHALHNHGNQRVSMSLLLQLGLVGASLTTQALGANKEAQALILGGLNMASTLGMVLPFSRDNESESDKTGLYLMAIAGYNPEESVPFWQRMAKLGGGTPEFLSTHPSPDNRQKALQKYIPEARRRAAQLKIDSIKETIPKAKKIAEEINGQ
jgi:predicted Zn-dependent protease